MVVVIVGVKEGCSVQINSVISALGSKVGSVVVGNLDGSRVTENEGSRVGNTDGSKLGSQLGSKVGSSVGI